MGTLARIVRVQPEFSLDAKGTGWLKFRSVAHAIQFQKDYANEEKRPDRSYMDDWNGLGEQPFSDYLATHTATHPLKLTLAARAQMTAPPMTYNRPTAAITGGLWDNVSVIQNLPLAARRRVRTKLAPVNLHFVTWYGSISDIAPIFPLTARLSAAINAYIIAGGAVTLRVTGIAEGEDADFRHVASSVNVQTASLAEIATALSPTFHRVTQIPLRQCMQRGYASLPRTANFIPGARELLGPKAALVAAFEKAIADLKIQ